MAWSRWVNGNQVSYGSGGWFRFVIDKDISGGSVKIRWGVESNYSLYDSSNNILTQLNNENKSYSVSISHGSDGGVTWVRSGSYTLDRGEGISADGYAEDLAGVSGRSSVDQVEYVYPALPPNQVGTPTVSNIQSTTHTVSWSAPSTNGAPITGYYIEWQTSGGSAVATAAVGASTRSYNGSGFTPNGSYRVRVYAKSSAGNGAVSAWKTFTQAVAVPIAPSAPSVSRNSDTSHSLTWSRGSQTQGPYASQQILRRVLSNNAWSGYAVIATVSPSATSYTDTTTSSNKAYNYQVRATNAAGTATSGSSGNVWTTPGLPTNQAANKDASANIVVTWSAPSSAASPSNLKYEVSESTDAGSTWAVKTTTAAGALSYTHTAPSNTVTHMYRIRAIINPTGVVGAGLASGYANTNNVQLTAPPAAPTNLTATPSGTVDRAQPIVLKWKHNPVDSSPQTKYTLQHRLAGTTTWTTVGPTSSSVSSYTLPGNTYPTGAAFEWQVATYGLHANPSPYSATMTVQLSSVPGVTISSPTSGALLATTALTVAWTFSDPDGDTQGSWQAILYGPDGGLLESKSGADTSSSVTFNTRLQETPTTIPYTVQVMVRDSKGLWSSPDTVSFGVLYPLPPIPSILDSTWDWKTGTVTLDLSVPAPAGSEVAVDHLEVWRSIDGGPLTRIATDIPPDTISYVDYTPTVSGTNSYIIQSVSALPSGAQSDPDDADATIVTPMDGDGRPGLFLNGGPDLTLFGRLAAEVSVDAKRLRDRVLQVYAGRPLPVEHTGEHVTETWDISGNLNLRWSMDVDDEGSPEDWLNMGSLSGPFLLRAPALFGGDTLYVYVSIDGPTLSRQVGGNVQKVSFTATRVAG